ncbi:MAG: response regulator transcription factor [Roseiflexaceae bacterium]
MTSARGMVLVVEDHDTTRHSLVYILQQAGYSVHDLADGLQAVARLQTMIHEGCIYDVILTDLLLQEATGIDLLKVARSLPHPPEVVLLTGYGTMHSAIDALRSDAFDYLLKPCKPDTLLDTVARAYALRQERRLKYMAIHAIDTHLQMLRGQLLGNTPTIDPAQKALIDRSYQLGRLIIDQLAHTVSFDGKHIVVTQTEFEILRVLIANVNTLVTYQDLVQQVYNQQLSPSKAHQLLKTHIHNLRNKIDRSYLTNVRGVGYKLVDGD